MIIRILNNKKLKDIITQSIESHSKNNNEDKYTTYLSTRITKREIRIIRKKNHNQNLNYDLNIKTLISGAFLTNLPGA